MGKNTSLIDPMGFVFLVCFFGKHESTEESVERGQNCHECRKQLIGRNPRASDKELEETTKDNPIQSMYGTGIFAYIWLVITVNAGKYAI